MNYLAPGPKTTESIFLGRCLFRNDRYTRMEPLLAAAASGWSVVSDRRRLFPDAGNVFTFDRLAAGAEEGSYWLFRCEQNNRSGRVEQDRFLAVDVREPIEVIDLGAGGSEAARRAVVEKGLDPARPPTRDVVVVTSPGKAVRLRLARDDRDGRWRVADPTSLDALDVFAIDASLYSGAHVSGRSFLLPEALLGHPTGIVDWSADRDFVPKVLRKLKKSAPLQSGGDLVELSNRAIERLTSAFVQAEALSGDPILAQAMVRRLTDLAPRLEANRDALVELQTVVLALPTVQNDIRTATVRARETASETLRVELRPAVRAEIEAEEREALSRLREIEDRIVTATDREVTLRRELADLTRERDAQRLGFTDEIREILAHLGGVGDVVRRVSDLSARFDLVPASSEVGHDVEPPWTTTVAADAGVLRLQDVAATFTVRERATGLPERALIEIDVVVRSGEIALLLGNEADRLIAAYVSCVSAGAAWRMSLDPAILGLDDLWRQAGGSKLTPFAKAWTRAVESPDRMVVVILDDIDAALGCSWLPRLAMHLRSSARPSNLLVLATTVTDPTTRGPSTDILTATVPMAFDGGTGAAVAAAMNLNAGEATCLQPGGCPKPTADLLGRFATMLVGVPMLRPVVAQRSAAILRAALATMDEAASLAFAHDAATHLSVRTQQTEAAATAIGRGFALVCRRL